MVKLGKLNIIDRITKGHKRWIKTNTYIKNGIRTDYLFTLCEMGSNEAMQCISQKKET